MDAKTVVRTQIMAEIIADQARIILIQSEQIGRLNEQIQTNKQAIVPPPATE